MSQTFMRMVAARLLRAMEREIEVISGEIANIQVKGEGRIKQKKARRKEIVAMRKKGLSLREIGARYGLSQEGIRKILNKNV